MRLVVIDVFPALLFWEGRDASGVPTTAPDAQDSLEHMAVHHRLAAVADGSITGRALRELLEDADLDLPFESATTSAESGPVVNARVIRRLAASLGAPIDAVTVVTARPPVAAAMRAARIAVVEVDGPADLAALPDAIDGWTGGPLSP